MIIKNEIGIKSKEEWNQKWEGIFDHYQQDLRNSYYVNAVLSKDDKRLLELGAGSFRDMANLNELGKDASGCDYSDLAVDLAKKHFPNLSEKIFVADSFNMPITNNEYDVTYHNGFWALFDDEAILSLAKEQARITRNKMIVTVHNAHNESFVNYFNELSEKDNLFQIRFFTIEEMTKLMGETCKNIIVIPVGKGKKFFEDKLISEGFTHPELLNKFFEISKLDHLNTSERLMCIGEVK